MRPGEEMRQEEERRDESLGEKMQDDKTRRQNKEMGRDGRDKERQMEESRNYEEWID